MVSERYLHYSWTAYWVWGDPMHPAVSPYASLFPQSAAFICISTLTSFKQSQRFSLLLFLAVCNLTLALEFTQDVSYWVTARSYRIALVSSVLEFLAEMWTQRGPCESSAFLGFVFFSCAKNLVLIMSNFKQQLFWTCMQRRVSLPWKSYLKRIMCVCGKWGALEYNIIIPAKLVSRFIDLLHKGPSKIKQTRRTATPVPWMLSVIHWPCPTRLVILPHAV